MLINNITDLKKFITVDGSVNFASVQPYIIQSEQMYIIPVLGQTLYNTLNAAYAANTLSANQLALWTQVNIANANFAWYLYLPVANVRMSEKGLVTSSTQETQQIAKWMYDKLENSLKRAAYNMLDALYDFLAAGAAGPADWYASWAAGSGFSTYSDLLVNTAEIFSNLTPINNSRWMYTLMRSHLKRAEKLFASDYIGIPFFTYLKEQYQGGSPSEADATVIADLQDIISLVAYSAAIRDPNIRQEITVMEGSQMDGIPATGSNRADVDNRTAFDRVADQYSAQAVQLMDNLRTYLNANATADVYAAYFTSPLYHNPNDAVEVHKYHNEWARTFFLI